MAVNGQRSWCGPHRLLHALGRALLLTLARAPPSGLAQVQCDTLPGRRARGPLWRNSTLMYGANWTFFGGEAFPKFKFCDRCGRKLLCGASSATGLVSSREPQCLRVDNLASEVPASPQDSSFPLPPGEPSELRPGHSAPTLTDVTPHSRGSP